MGREEERRETQSVAFLPWRQQPTSFVQSLSQITFTHAQPREPALAQTLPGSLQRAIAPRTQKRSLCTPITTSSPRPRATAHAQWRPWRRTPDALVAAAAGARSSPRNPARAPCLGTPP